MLLKFLLKVLDPMLSKNEVQAYEAEVKAKLSIVEVEKIVAESKLAENNLKN